METIFRLKVPAKDEYRAAQAASVFLRLSWLDDVWTEYLSAPGGISPADRPVLREVGAEMQALLGESAQQAGWLEGLVGQHEQDFEDAMASAHDLYPLESTEKFELYDLIGPGRGFPAKLRAATAHIQSVAPIASEEIALELKSLEAGHSTEGDLKKRLKCAILLAAAGAALCIHGAVGDPGTFSVAVLAFMVQVTCTEWLQEEPAAS